MLRSKVAALAVGAALGVGVMAVPAVADTGTETTTPVPGGGATTITLAGIGTITLNVDATTGAISNVVLTPDSGVTAGAPVVTPEGVQIPVTLADGTQQLVQVTGEVEGGVPSVETEVKPSEDGSDSEGDAPGTLTPTTPEPEDSGEGPSTSTPPPTTPESHSTSPGSPSSGDFGGSD